MCLMRGLKRPRKVRHKIYDPDLGSVLKLCDKCYEKWKVLNDTVEDYGNY